MPLTTRQADRYRRQTQLPAIGEHGQDALLHSAVLLVGVGGLGSPAALYLAAAGVGTVGLMDDDTVDLSNLQRQILYRTSQLQQSKLVIAATELRSLNEDVTVRCHPARLTRDNAPDILPAYDFVIDATDNLDSKFLIADMCHSNGIPYSHAGICRFYGQTMTVLPGRSACYRCVFEHPPDDPDTTPIGPLGALPGIVGCIQACEAIKALTGCGNLLTDRLLTVDTLSMQFRTVKVARRLDCALCGA